MDLGSEISKNFKDSIKQKLQECGTYIDDELPEYIMVMIANKRHEDQMKEDLSLFLGDETDNFVNWLFQMITNLQNVAQDKLKAYQPEVSNLQVVKTKEESNIENDKHQNRNEVNNVDPNEISILTEQGPDINDDATKFRDNAFDVLENEEEHTTETKNGIGKRRRESGERKRKIQESQLGKVPRNESSKRKRSSISSSSKERENDRSESEEETSSTRKVASAVTVQKIRPSLPRSRQPPGSLIMRAINEANLSVASKPRRGHDQIEVEAQQDDSVKRKVELKRGRSTLHEKATTVGLEVNAEEKGSELNEFETPSKRKSFGDQEKLQDDDIELEVGENEFIDEGNEMKQKSSTRIVISHGGIEGDYVDSETDTGHDNEKENFDQREKRGHSGRNHGGGSKRTEKCEDDEDKKSSNSKKRKFRRSSHRERRSSPKFIVTLHGGLDERANEVQKQQHQQHSRELDRLLIDLNPKGPMAVLESAQNEVNRMARQLDLLQSVSIPTSGSFLPILLSQGAVIAPPRSDVVSSITRPVFQETLPLMSMKNALPENKFVQQPNRIVSSIPTPLPAMQTAFEDRENAKIGNQNREVVVPLQTENDSEHDEVEENGLKTESFQETVLERCKFWPNCKNASCIYVHPSRTCRMFPNCSFKDKCMFIHPMCKFDKRCINPECPFSHTSKSRDFLNFESKVTSSFMTNKGNNPLCKFIPNCTKSNCPFRHPVSKPCRYGSSCKRADCLFHHETKPATGDSLKWTSTTSNVQKHISERKFAVRDKEVTEVPVEIRSNVK